MLRTPNLDELAAQGVKLENYYVQPICTPTRSQLMSGRYQIHTGLQHGVIHPTMPAGLPTDIDILPNFLCGGGATGVLREGSRIAPGGLGYKCHVRTFPCDCCARCVRAFIISHPFLLLEWPDIVLPALGFL